MEIRGKNALVSGAAKRLGKEIALELARQGASVVVHYHRSVQDAEQTAAEIRALGSRVALLSADLSEQEAALRLAEKAQQAFDGAGIDILINSASVFPRTPFGSVEPATWEAVLNLNLRAPFFLSQALSEQMKKKGAGKIINLGDAGTPYAPPDFMPYAAAKSGIEALTRGLARALAPHVQVNAVLPGAILPAAELEEDTWEVAIRQNLLKRPGAPEDITRAICFLIENDFLTGVLLPVDGGRSLGR